MASFPSTLPSGNRMDSKKFSIESQDTALRSEQDGGYTVTRARHTRKPRKMFNVGYTHIETSDLKVITDFYDSVFGGSVIFDWFNQQDLLTYQVRFKGNLKRSYDGHGMNQRWNVDFQLEQA